MADGRRDRREVPDDEDRRLWHQLTRSVRPLRGRAAPPPAAGEADDGHAFDPREDGAERPEEARGAPPVRPRPPPAVAAVRRLEVDTLHGVDAGTVRRLRRGRVPIEGRLDLHGMTRRQAAAALARFLADAQGQGWRCVVVITGRGRRAPLEPETGVLKAALPRWLNEPGNRQRLLGFASARPVHGGEGAFYLLLKRAPGTGGGGR